MESGGCNCDITPHVVSHVAHVVHLKAHMVCQMAQILCHGGLLPLSRHFAEDGWLGVGALVTHVTSYAEHQQAEHREGFASFVSF